MKYIFIGLLLGATVTSTHDAREACEGKAVLLREKGVTGYCEKLEQATTDTGKIAICPNGTCR